MKKFGFINICLVVVLLQGCSAGMLRAFNDAMTEQNGYTVTYPDQSDVTYVGEVRVTVGVRNGEGYYYAENTGEDYCKVRFTLEDNDYEYLFLDPYESSGSVYMSIYNQVDYIDTLCNTTSKVFNDPFDE